jgi:hypothetical protein
MAGDGKLSCENTILALALARLSAALVVGVLTIHSAALDAGRNDDDDDDDDDDGAT